MESKLSFNKPLIVFRIKSDEAYNNSKKICQYLLETNKVEYIYVEKRQDNDPQILNSETVFANNEESKKKYSKCFKIFSLDNEDSNLCIILGGDGTCLWANKIYKHKERPPFLCFHKGKLGFLSIYDLEKYKEVLDELYLNEKDRVIGSIDFTKRQLIECDLYETEINKDRKYKDFNGYKLIRNVKGMNEITVERKKNMINLEFYLEDDLLTLVDADGIIVATPTGSTAYNLSAGGPILHNKVEGMILSAICPFSLSLRPIVFPKGEKIRFRNNTQYEKEREAKIKFDGFDVDDLKDNQYIEIYLSDFYISFVVLKKFCGSVEKLWMEKLSSCLRWNYQFSH